MMSLLMDALTMIMLTATIIYAARLNGKLTVIRNQKADLEATLAAFSIATEKAVNAVNDLQLKGEGICRQIDEKVKKGQVMADDIEFLIDRAAKRMNDFENKQSEASQKSKLGGFSESELVNLLRQKQKQAAYAN